MGGSVAIVHGWSDSSNSFRDLREFLQRKGWQAIDIWLADYISMEDDIRVEDVAKRMDRVIDQLVADGTLRPKFDLIVHSTGGLVAREWLTRYYPDGKHANGADCPVKRLVMLAPANFGSALAALGKSMVGRVTKGWNNWFQTGTEMLSALELASSYQWDLARRDLFDMAGDGQRHYGADRVWPFVIVGSRAYPTGLRKIVNEDGSDGTVRCTAANLNAVGVTIDFSGNPKEPAIRPWKPRWTGTFPLAVLPDRDHSTIHQPDKNAYTIDQFSNRLGELIVEALRCDGDQKYSDIAWKWEQISEETEALGRDPAAMKSVFNRYRPAPEALHQHFQMVTAVRDDEGRPVEDYFLEFYSPQKNGNADVISFHTEVIRDVHVNSRHRDMRCLFLDRTELLTNYYRKHKDQEEVAVSISAAPAGPNVRYFDSTKEGAKGELVIHCRDEQKRENLAVRLFRNTTHLVEVIIPRRPVDKVFRLSQ